MEIKGKIILVTGAARGIGYELCSQFIQKEAVLIAIDKDQDSLISMEEKFKGKIKSYACDLSSEIQITSVIDKIKEDFEHVDILINNAGVGVYKPLTKLTLQEWRDSYYINVFAPFQITKELIELVKSGYKGGKCLYIGSVSGITPMANRALYCSTKFALRGMVLSLADEYKDGIPRFSIISLGSTLTEFGSLTISEKIKLQSEGKKYFNPVWVAKKIVSTIEQDSLENEIVLDPEKLL